MISLSGWRRPWPRRRRRRPPFASGGAALGEVERAGLFRRRRQVSVAEREPRIAGVGRRGFTFNWRRRGDHETDLGGRVDSTARVGLQPFQRFLPALGIAERNSRGFYLKNKQTKLYYRNFFIFYICNNNWRPNWSTRWQQCSVRTTSFGRTEVDKKHTTAVDIVQYAKM